MHQIRNAKLGRFIRKARDAKGLSLRELAADSGFEHTTLQRMEKGMISSPDPRRLQKLAAALEVDVEDLFELSGYPSDVGLPELTPYLRAKFDLSKDAAENVERYIERLKTRGRKPARKGKGGGRG